MPTHPLYQGALLIALAELFLVCSGMIVKQISADLPTEIIVFSRNLLGLCLLLPWLMRNGISVVKTNHLRFHFMRAAIGVSAMTCLFYSWGNLPLAQAALLKQTAPFFTPILAFIWLGERIGFITKGAIVLGLIGVFFILQPTEGVINYVVIIALFGAMLSGFVKVVVRRMGATESPQKIVFYFAFFSSLIASLPAMWNWQMPTLVQGGWLFLLAITSTLAQLSLSKGYALAPAGSLGPFTYISVVFAALLGWWIWDELLELDTFIGISLVVTAGILALVGKRQEQLYER